MGDDLTVVVDVRRLFSGRDQEGDDELIAPTPAVIAADAAVVYTELSGRFPVASSTMFDSTFDDGLLVLGRAASRTASAWATAPFRRSAMRAFASPSRAWRSASSVFAGNIDAGGGLGLTLPTGSGNRPPRRATAANASASS